MKKLIPAGALLFLLALPHHASSQEFGLGVRAGFLGLGGEAAVGLTDYLVVRGGFGVFPIELDGEFDDVDYTVSFPSNITTLGIDLYPGGKFFRIMAGMMFRSGNIEVQSADLAGIGVEIGDTTYTEAGTLSGVLESKNVAPFVGIGFGRHTSAGFGVTVDLGVAFVGDPDVQLEANGALASAPDIQEELDREAQNFEDDAGGFLKFWPVISVGLKIPVG